MEGTRTTTQGTGSEPIDDPCRCGCGDVQQPRDLGGHEERPALQEGAGERLRGVHLYGLARPSLQPGAERLERLSPAELEAVAVRIRALGLPVTVSP